MNQLTRIGHIGKSFMCTKGLKAPNRPDELYGTHKTLLQTAHDVETYIYMC